MAEGTPLTAGAAAKTAKDLPSNAPACAIIEKNGSASPAPSAPIHLPVLAVARCIAPACDEYGVISPRIVGENATDVKRPDRTPLKNRVFSLFRDQSRIPDDVAKTPHAVAPPDRPPHRWLRLRRRRGHQADLRTFAAFGVHGTSA